MADIRAWVCFDRLRTLAILLNFAGRSALGGMIYELDAARDEKQEGRAPSPDQDFA